VTKKTAAPRRILVVNDTQEILDLFRDLLEEEGYHVSVYSYAFRDLEEVKKVAPDLVILDYIIGGEDYGWQLLQKLKLDRETAKLPVIVCTAAVRQVREMEGRLHEKGVAVVLKPFDIDDLLREIESAFGNPIASTQDVAMREAGE
jgi:CheY-like chemotaxis protein